MTADAPEGPTTAHDVRLADELARGASRLLLDLRTMVDAGTTTSEVRALGAAGDATSHSFLVAGLAEARSADVVLSEGARDDPGRLGADRVWIVDPLDGTREFAERDDDGRWRDDFAVHLALWRRDQGLVAGVVALPARGRVYASSNAIPCSDGAARQVLAGDRALRLAVSRTRPPEIAQRLTERADVELVPMGSCGVKAMAVLDGIVDAYVHAGGQYEWDSAAPVAVARAAGLTATRLDGSSLEYNRADPWSPDLVISHPALLGHLTAILAAAGSDPRVSDR